MKIIVELVNQKGKVFIEKINAPSIELGEKKALTRNKHCEIQSSYEDLKQSRKVSIKNMW